ncbi:MAG TPA: precorrin-8X methylmutase [Pseudonocardiaceae bacterium]
MHPIETQSYRILRDRVDTGRLPPHTRAVVERVIHATADTSWIGDLAAEETVLAQGRAALLDGAPIVTDARMVAAGITTRDCAVALDEPGVAELAREQHITRSAAGIRLAAQRYPDGAVWVIGNAPTALLELVDQVNGGTRPALVVGVPVGFVDAVISKAMVRATGVPVVSTLSERGGAAVAAAIVNALLYFDEEDYL